MSELPVGEIHRNHETERYWQAVDEGRLELPICDSCGFVVWYPRAICSECLSSDLTWTAMSGRGTVYSYTVVHGGVSRKWKPHLPYVVAYVELDEGPRVLTNLIGVDPEVVSVGMAVTAAFDTDDDGNTVLRFTAE